MALDQATHHISLARRSKCRADLLGLLHLDQSINDVAALHQQAVHAFIDRVDLRAAIPVSILVPAGIYYAITHWLKIQMPAGVLAPWLS